MRPKGSPGDLKKIAGDLKGKEEIKNPGKD